MALRVRLINIGSAGSGMTEEVHSLTNHNPSPAISRGAVPGGFIALGLGLILVFL